MPRQGRIVRNDGTKIGVMAAATLIGTTIRKVITATEQVGFQYDDIKKFIYENGEKNGYKRPKSFRVERLDPDEVYLLGSYSKGQRNHRQILMQLCGLHPEDEEAFDERFPDA